jgi:hypothetical protein
MPRPGRTQLAILEHLAQVAVIQKEMARDKHKKFEGGWTDYDALRQHLNPRQRRALDALVAYGAGTFVQLNLVPAGSWEIRISRAGVEALETHLGREIMA